WVRRWREANRERLDELGREWRAANPEKVRAAWRRSLENNRESSREAVRRWQAANPEKYRESNARWREANPDKVRAARVRRLARGNRPCRNRACGEFAEVGRYYCAPCDSESSGRRYARRARALERKLYDQQGGLCPDADHGGCGQALERSTGHH